MNFVQSITTWVKNNKLAAVLLGLLVFLFGRNLLNTFIGISGMTMQTASYQSRGDYGMVGAPAMMGKVGSYEMADSYYVPEPLPPSSSENRLVVFNSNMSLLVKNVAETTRSFINFTESIGGFMVNSNLSNPEEAATATLDLRVPSNQLEQALEYFRSASVKVVSENLSGQDVTDQFEDIDEKLRILRTNKARMEGIMAQASEISDIVNIQQQIFNLQSQIDSHVGRQQYLLKTSQLSSVTIYLSTDEFSLPYTPDEPWRPNVVFKRAVRSLVATLQNVGTLGIWVGVYSVLIVPAIVLIVIIKRKLISRKPMPPAK